MDHILDPYAEAYEVACPLVTRMAGWRNTSLLNASKLWNENKPNCNPCRPRPRKSNFKIKPVYKPFRTLRISVSVCLKPWRTLLKRSRERLFVYWSIILSSKMMPSSSTISCQSTRITVDKTRVLNPIFGELR